MTRYEYKVVPAPTKGTKARGVKTPQGRFAHSVETVLNAMGAEGWEYLRAELLPSDERSGLTGTTTNWRNVLVFRRALPEGAEKGFEPRLVAVTGPESLPDTGEDEKEPPVLYSRSGFHPEDAADTGEDDPLPDSEDEGPDETEQSTNRS